MNLFNTYGYSLNELEEFKQSSINSRIAIIRDKVLSWSDFEREEYIESLKSLHEHLRSKGLDILSGNSQIKKDLLVETQLYIGSASDTIARGFIRVLRKEMKDGMLKNGHKSGLNNEINQESKDSFARDERTVIPLESISNEDDFYLLGEIHTEKKDWGISRLYDLYIKGKLVLQPTFQRKFVWDKKKSSRLIESVLLNFPIPLIYLSEEKDGSYVVIDGQQRLQSIFSYIDGRFPNGTKFKLNGVALDINAKLFKEQKEQYQDKLLDYSLACVVFKKQSDPNVKFEVFERLNTGSVPLNAQEVRNCIYHGSYNDLLIRLSENKDFKHITNFDDKSLYRLKGVEWVLRFAAFYNQTYLKYRSSKTFLNEEMQCNQEIDETKAAKLENAFKNSVSLILSIFGKHAFSRYIKKDDNSGYWDSKKNAALYEVLMFSFADISKNKAQPHLDSIREALMVLMTKNEYFKDSITMRTNNKSMVARRFKIWLDALDKIINIEDKEPRCFSFKVKQKLFDKNQTCEICGQNINDIDDAEVDHIEQYWLGGKTIPENARLVHRYCNRSRSKYD